MWLTTALSLVALAMAMTVRTEIEATRYRIEAEQGRFLARGAIEQAVFVMKNTGLRDAEQKPFYEAGRPYMDFVYSTGAARVLVVPEAGKLNVNLLPPERLRALLEAAGASEPEAREITEAIVDWRAPASPTLDGPFDQYYAALPRPYRGAHRPFERTEDLLLVRGVTPELFYGWMEADVAGRSVRRGGINRLLTTYGMAVAVNVNYAPYEVLLTLPGMDPQSAAALVAGRRAKPYATPADLPLALPLEAVPYLTMASTSETYSLLATGRPNGSDVRTSVRALFRRDLVTGETKLARWEEMANGSEM